MGSLPGFLGSLIKVLIDRLLGNGALGIAAAVMFLVRAVAAVVAQPPLNRLHILLGLGATLVVVLFPMLFVAHWGFDWMSYTRYLWVAWIAVCVVVFEVAGAPSAPTHGWASDCGLCGSAAGSGSEGA